MTPRHSYCELIHRLKRLAGNVLAVLGVTILLLAGGALPAAPQAFAAPQKDQSSGPLSSFGACLSGKGEGSLVLLMDQSGSLRQSESGEGESQGEPVPCAASRGLRRLLQGHVEGEGRGIRLRLSRAGRLGDDQLRFPG